MVHTDSGVSDEGGDNCEKEALTKREMNGRGSENGREGWCRWREGVNDEGDGWMRRLE